LREGGVFHAPSTQQPRQALVPFDATGLGIKSVLLIALQREFLFTNQSLI
jgi:hypothetical protein